MGLIKQLIISSALKNNSKRPISFVSWHNTKTLALLVDCVTAYNKSLMDKFIYESDKVVDVYYLDLKVKESAVKNFITFTKTDKNVFGLPNAKALLKLTKKYDVLINASFSYTDYADVLSDALAADCKVSFENRQQVFNLIVERRQEQNIQFYLKEVVNYLKMIRN